MVGCFTVGGKWGKGPSECVGKHHETDGWLWEETRKQKEGKRSRRGDDVRNAERLNTCG